jgi:L-rhamnose-H+ transport protein
MSLALGILLVVIGGALEGTFSLPVTRTPRWKWENIWGLGSLVALVLFPWPVAFATIPNLGEVYSQVSPWLIAFVFSVGILWGLGGIFWGKGIAAVGMAMGISIMMGLTTVISSPVLLAVSKGPAKLLERGGLVLLAAVAIMVVGVLLCALAGIAKQRDLSQGVETPDTKNTATPFAVGLMLCIISAVFSSMLNFGFVYGEPLKEATLKAQVSAASANNAIWALIFTGNYLVNAAYACFLMWKNRTAKLIVSQGSAGYWIGVFYLGIAWPLGVILYGIGADRMGKYGAFIAFPMLLVMSILFANLAGALTGEWRGVSRKTKLLMSSGILVLIGAFVVFGLSNALLEAK